MLDALRVRLLGEFSLDGVDVASLRSRQARRMLKRLALSANGVVDVDRLIDAVWGDRPPADPAADLLVLISRTRALVGSDRVVRRDGGYALIAEWSDRDEVTRLATEADRRREAGDVAGARAAAASALALVRGPLLADEGEADWVLPARLAMQTLVAEVRNLAATLSLESGLLSEAVVHARAALLDDPYDERAVRTTMAAHVASGRSASALAVYAELRHRLVDDLGVDPSVETEALYTSIVTGEVSPPMRRATNLGSFVARTSELAMLDSALDQSSAGARVVVVTGEPGVGTTSLLEAWAAHARERGVLVIAGRATEGVDLALQPVIDALAGVTPMAAGEPEESHAGFRPLGPGAVDTALQLAMFDEARRVLESVRPDAGVALLIDDAHLADPVTIEWLGHVLRHRAAHRVLVVAAMAEGEGTVPPSSTVVRLEPLQRDQAELLVGAGRIDELWPLTGGNPLLLVEFGNRLQDGSIPSTIRDAVAERLQRAGAAAGTLRVAAVLGPTVDLDLLAGVLERSPLDLLDELDEGVRRAFLTERDGALAFRHELVRQAVAADANAARRTFLHRQAARWLMERSDAVGGALPLEVARHARAGGDARLAAECLVVAAQEARDRIDLAGAEALLDEAVELHDHAAVRLARSRIRMARGNLAGADDDAAAAMGFGAEAKALELRAWIARYRHDMDAAIRLGRAGAAVSSDPSTTASCLLAVAFAHRGSGDLRAADALLGEARALDLPRAQSVDAWLGVLRVHQGRPDEALASLEPLFGSEPADLHSFWVEHVLQMTAHAYGLVGRVSDAFEVLDRLDQELVRRGTTARYNGLSDNYRSWLWRGLASPEAIEAARRAIESAATTEIRGQAHLDLADALERAGRHVDADEAMRRAIAEMGTRWFHNRWRCEQRAGLIEARLHLQAGSADDALTCAAAVAHEADARGDLRYSSMARVHVALARIRLNDPVDVSATLADAATVGRVAAPEAWSLAADLADAWDRPSGNSEAAQHARRLAGTVGAALVLEAGVRGVTLSRALEQRLA